MQTKRDKIDALLDRSFTKSQDAALLAEMLSLPNDGRYTRIERALRHSADKRRLRR
jgi:hypothetical protein